MHRAATVRSERYLQPWPLGCFLAVALVTSLSAQTHPAPLKKPYATLDRNAVAYSGPGRATSADLQGKTITLGILVPMRGPEATEGKAMLAAAQLALDEAVAQHPARRLRLAVGDETGPWGRVSNEIVRLLFQEAAVALITPPDGNTAHQAEQIANKIGVPVLTLSGDSTTTEINLPWIFRLVPSDADQAQILAQQIYQVRHLQRVLFVYQDNHDGRIGQDEFQKAVQRLRAPPPAQMKLLVPFAQTNLKDSDRSDQQLKDLQSLITQVHVLRPQALVLWTSSRIASILVALLRKSGPALPLYLCRKAAETAPLEVSTEDEWTVLSVSTGDESGLRNFTDHYFSQTGEAPTFTAAETYDAVHLIAAALLRSGPNRARLRDALARGTLQGLSGPLSFDPAGNLDGEFVVTKR
jgi:branched-chain amino acid transport system substrate-binding protein